MVKQLSVRSYRPSQPSLPNRREQQQQQQVYASPSTSTVAAAAAAKLELSSARSQKPSTFRFVLFMFALLALVVASVFLVRQQYNLVKIVTQHDNELGIMPIAFELEHLISRDFHHQNDRNRSHSHSLNIDVDDNNSKADADAGAGAGVQSLDFDRFESLIAQSDRISDSQKELLIKAIMALQDGKRDKTNEVNDAKGKELKALVSTGDDMIPKIQPNSPYAYMFLIGGIHEDRPAYRGFLYNVLVATRLFRQLKSTADIWLFTQMSPDSKFDTLPSEELQQLRSMDIHVHQLPTADHDTFTHLVFSKFRGLQMTQYRRVIFVDADVIPLANLDYLFHLSDPLYTETPTILQPNLIMATRGEPCNAGVFMLEPEDKGWDHVWKIINRQRKEAAAIQYPHFSWTRGWGHDFIKEKDSWRSTNSEGKRWKFHAGHSDQGLLYYWVKYVKQHTSIVIRDEIENWVPDPNGGSKPFLSNTLYNQTLLQYSSNEPLVYQMSCDREIHLKTIDKLPLQCVVPYRDFSHFMGSQKPWERGNPKRFHWMEKAKTDDYIASTKLFFDTLLVLNDELNLGLNFDRWHIDHLPQLKNNSIGRMSMYHEIILDVMKIKNMTSHEYDIWQGFQAKEPSDHDKPEV